MRPQRKALTLAVFSCVVALASWVMPWGYDGDEASAAGSSPSEAPPSPSPSQDAMPSTSPEPTATVTPTPEPEPEVTPSPVRPDRRASDPEKRTSVLVAELTTSIAGSPTTIEVGEETTLTATLSNPGDTAATGAGMTISVPNPLQVSSTSPDPDQIDTDPGGVSINYEFGTLGPGASQTAVITAEGDRDPGSPVVVEVAGRADGLTSFAQEQITVEEPGVPLVEISDPAGPTFAQVGESVTYTLKISNPGQTPATELAIVYLVPDEIDVERAGLPNGVDAVQVGAFQGKEDIVWVIDKLGPGKQVTVDWLGKVVKAGDLAAAANVRAEAAGVVVDRGRTSTYLADEAGTGTDNPEFDPVVRRTVTTETVRVDSPSARVPTETGDTTGGSELPFTGSTPSTVVLFAVGLVAGGALLVALASRRFRGRKVVVGSIALLIVATACMGSEEPPPDRVKGETITRGDGDGNGNGSNGNGEGNEDVLDEPAVDPDQGSGDEGDVGAGGDLGDLAGPVDDGFDDDVVVTPPPATDPVPGEPETRVVRRVRTRTIEADDLAIQSSPSLTGDTRMVSSSGGGRSTVRAGAAVLSSHVAARGGRLATTVTLVNFSEKRRLHVSGELLYKVAGFGMLRSGSIDELLNPNGEVTARFEFRLPGGSFTAQPLFSAS